MREYLKTDQGVLYLGDCIEVLKTLEDNSVDSIVTDPPYELGFMGKSWDNTGIANSIEMWSECLRVLKPGGHLLAFSGTRTYHRMASAIEDAGFEVRDMIEWVYGSGFPKSLNIGKAVDKLQGNEREVVGEKVRGDVQKAKETGSTFAVADANKNNEKIFGYGVETLTKGTSEWEGWGTALKPAHEPICMARKSLSEKTIAENCLKWGTGGINIDESRVGTEIISIHNAPKGTFAGGEPDRGSDTESYRDSVGRFPANLIHDNIEEVRECFPDTKSQGHWSKTKTTGFGEFGNGGSEYLGVGEKDKEGGNASRFFKSIIYQAKASKSERNKGCEGLEEKQKAGAEFRPNHQEKANNGETGNPFGRWNKVVNNHPTVKPIALMEYLIKMVTPKGGVVLDPFMGSGSTGVACKNLNRVFIGIDMTEEYCEIAKARITYEK